MPYQIKGPRLPGIFFCIPLDCAPVWAIRARRSFLPLFRNEQMARGWVIFHWELTSGGGSVFKHSRIANPTIKHKKIAPSNSPADANNDPTIEIIWLELSKSCLSWLTYLRMMEPEIFGSMSRLKWSCHREPAPLNQPQRAYLWHSSRRANCQDLRRQISRVKRLGTVSTGYDFVIMMFDHVHKCHGRQGGKWRALAWRSERMIGENMFF
jgi:hypothetical protein